MKKVWTVFLVLLFVVLSIVTIKGTQTKLVSGEVSTSGYAKIVSNDCYFLSEPNLNSRVFLLEQSYFVKVEEVFDNVFYKVKYLDFEGYVEKSKISFVEEYPQNPFLSGITFDIYDISNVCMRSTPETLDTDTNVLCTIKISTKDITYYGKCAGEEAVKGLGNVWLYSAYQDEYGNFFKGYIYSPFTRNLSAITSSSENLTAVNIANYVPVDNLLYLNLSTKNMLIVVTIIPTIFVIYLFTKQGKKIEYID